MGLFICVIVLVVFICLEIQQRKIDYIWYFLKHHQGELGKNFREYIKPKGL
jgi:hypothetical protein